jgi:predicted AAA+ superfamily ATPase
MDSFFERLFLVLDKKPMPRGSLVIFDEVQSFPRAREAIKPLVADGRYHYVETGSLVSIRKNTEGILIPSEERHVKMYPMDFEEFLWATGRDSLMDAIRTFFAGRRPLGAAVHRRAMEAFRQYLVVGGMPQAVAEFAASHDLKEVDLQKRAILGLYRDDIWKHAGAAAPKIERIFDEIPSQLSRHEKKFRIGDLGDDAKMRDWADSFQWLESAMFANRCWNSTQPNVGLKMNLDNKSVKCYLADTGLLVSHAFDESELVSENVHRRILLDRIALNEGMLVENMAAQMLVAAGRKLYFHSESSSADSKSRMEIDFLVAKSKLARRHNVSPVEIKSGKNATHSSLDKFRRKYSDWCGESFLFWDRDVRVEGGVTYLPLYMIPLL